MKIYSRLLQFLRPYIWPYFCVAAICLLLFSATDAAIPFLVRDMLDKVFVNKERGTLLIIVVLIVALFSFRGVINFGQGYLMDYIGLHIVRDLRQRLCEKLQWLSLSFFHQHPTGTLLSRVTSDVTQVRGALTGAVTSLARNSTAVVALTIVAFYMDWFLAAIAFVAFPGSVLPIRRLTSRIKRATKRGQVSTGVLTTILQESIQGSPIVKAFGMEDYEVAKFRRENDRILRQVLKAARAKAIIPSAMELLASFGIAGVVYYGGMNVMDGGRTPGQFFAFLTSMFLMYQPFKNLTKSLPQVYQGIAGGERIFEVLDAPMAVSDAPDAVAIQGFADRIQLRDVKFSYGAEPVLWSINLDIERGQVIALVGMSGAGKSTICSLIPRFYDVSGGSITIDGRDLRNVTVGSLRAQMSLVTQYTFLFNDTVRNNISYGDPSRSEADIFAAAKAANAHDFIMALPQQYDTMIGELGLKLSGGQRQRIAIARALLKNAPILILDEATSSLDSASESLVQEALQNLMVDRTTLVIAHRLSTIRTADRIVVLVAGRIVEEGTHEELLGRKSEYSRLYSLQFRDEEETAEKVLH
jgi:subfamily B ATP-binding cassette protein MsbA